MEDMSLVIGLVATAVAIIVSLGTLMKWLIDGLDKRLSNVETDVRTITRYLLETKTAS